VAGLIFAFCFSWQSALVAMAFVPFMMIGAAITAANDKANA
jgi:ABC-type transport system involved in cytochrome bd biosynthesis fused ATPase/permease subunit